MRKLIHVTAALIMSAFLGCAAEEGQSEIAEDMPTPSEAAKVSNENPTSPTVDVPNTAVDEEARAESDAPAPTPTATEKADASSAPTVVPSPGEPTPEVKDEAADKKEAEAPK